MHKNGVDLLLDVGKELMECGAESVVVEECMDSLAKKLEFEITGITVLPKSILVTTIEDGHYKTKVGHINYVVPDFRKLSEIYRLCQKDGIDDPNIIRSGLSLILYSKKHTKIRFLTTPLAIFAFAIIFGADIYGATSASIAGLSAYFMKDIVLHGRINVMLVNLISAFIATIGVFLIAQVIIVSNISVAQAAAVIFLVPGVPLINSLEDMLKGHYLNGVARGMRAFFLTFGVVVGIIIALSVQSFIGKIGWF